MYVPDHILLFGWHRRCNFPSLSVNLGKIGTRRREALLDRRTLLPCGMCRTSLGRSRSPSNLYRLLFRLVSVQKHKRVKVNHISFYTSTKLWRGYIFTAVCLSFCLCTCVSDVCLWTKFQPNGWTDSDAVFAKWLLPALARTLLKLVTLGQRSRSQWRNTHFFFIILC